MLKGKACINCRRRKIKCDGDRPSCGQCARSNGAFEDCEYPGDGLTQTQLLENQISHLQNRIRNFERNNDERPPILLHHPDSRASSPRFAYDATVDKSHSHESLPPRPSSSSSSASKSDSSQFTQEPSTDIRLALIDVFYQHAPRFGFFLNVERFHNSFIQPQQIGHYSRPTPALLNAVYLWATYLSPSAPDGCDEKSFLRNALHHLSKDFSSLHPYKIIEGIQAEVLLSYYYLLHGKVLGGNYHATAAVSLSLSSGLHRIRTPEPPSTSSLPTSSPRLPQCTLPKPIDDAEEGERVDAFWAVLILNNTWIAIQESHSMFYDLKNIGVDTPWPMDVVQYQLQLLPPTSSGTIGGFLDSTSIEGCSVVALHAKASVLLEQATVYAPSHNGFEYTGPSEHFGQTPEFTRLDTVIDQFKAHFPSVDRMDVKPFERDTLLMVQLMTQTATIKLHAPRLKKGSLHSIHKALSAAQAIAILTHNILPSSSIRVDPIVGVLWTAACEVFIDELLRVDSVVTGNNPQWSTLLHSILSQMNKFSENNAFMKFLVNRIHKNHPAALTSLVANW